MNELNPIAAAYLEYADTLRHERLVRDMARFIYPTPIWFGGMENVHPRTAHGYAVKLAEKVELA